MLLLYPLDYTIRLANMRSKMANIASFVYRMIGLCSVFTDYLYAVLVLKFICLRQRQVSLPDALCFRFIWPKVRKCMRESTRLYLYLPNEQRYFDESGKN